VPQRHRPAPSLPPEGASRPPGRALAFVVRAEPVLRGRSYIGRETQCVSLSARSTRQDGPFSRLVWGLWTCSAPCQKPPRQASVRALWGCSSHLGRGHGRGHVVRFQRNGRCPKGTVQRPPSPRRALLALRVGRGPLSCGRNRSCGGRSSIGRETQCVSFPARRTRQDGTFSRLAGSLWTYSEPF
jgi:hypothetical protein